MAENGAAGTAALALDRHLFRAGAARPFLREPIERLGRIPDAGVWGLATDGRRIFYPPDGAPTAEDVEHLLMHCLYRHLRVPERAVAPLWDLACDLSAEYLRTEFFPAGDGALTRLRIADALPEGIDPRVPRAVYRALMDLFEDELTPLYARFRRDDHRYWYAPPAEALFDGAAASPDGGRLGAGERRADADGPRFDPAAQESYAEWVEVTLEQLWPSEDELPGGTAMTGRYGLNPGSREERMRLRAAGKYDFSRYLRRFSTTKEELRLDTADFDLIPYYYGLTRYGSLPLIEPLETTESHRVETLVIAIDTSGSCTLPVVARFFAEIERILLRHDCFFARMNVHILQCDAFVQSDTAIHSLEDWRRYTKDLVVKGRSGTDFRPVFRWVEKLQAQGALKGLKGLLYFTDGDGAYPQEKPPYETAFVFSSRKALNYQMPDWIIPLCLEGPDREMTPKERGA